MKFLSSTLIIIVLIIGMLSASADSKDQTYLFFKNEDIARLKTAVKSGPNDVQNYANNLRILAEQLLEEGPWSVTDYPSPAISGDPHDYYSEGPYWWPDPENPNGPYIRKDGLRNPDRYLAHKTILIKMHQSAFVLSLAGFLFDDIRFSKKAAEIIRVWFLDEKSKMNPNLNYAQAIRNKSIGRGVGIIDTRRFAVLMEAFNFLEQSGIWPGSEQEKLKEWFRIYLNWLKTSPNGQKEKYQGNNHTTWWCTQVAAIAEFVNDDTTRRMVYDYVRENVIPAQIASDGSFPEELARTKSFDYTQFNLTAFCVLAQIAWKDKVDLWDFKPVNGKGIRDAFDYFLPFYLNPASWKHEQITKFKKEEPVFLGLTGLKFKNSDYLHKYEQTIENPAKFDTDRGFDPFILLLNLIVLTQK